MYMVYRNILNIELEARRYSFSPHRSAPTINDSERSRRVMLQGVLYSLSLFLSWIFLINIFGKKELYVTYILSYMFWPLQGFFNALIYAIPVFQRMYKRWKVKRKERQTVVVSSKLEDKKDTKDKKDEHSKNLCILSKVSKNEKKQGTSHLNVGNRNTMPILTNNNIIEENNVKSIIKNNQQHNHPALVIGETSVLNDGGNNEFDGEEAKEEIQKNSKSSIIHPGIRRNDNNQFQLKRNDESNIVSNIECSSDNDYHGSDVCDGEVLKGGKTQVESKYISRHHSSIDKSCESEENVEGGFGFGHDAGESDYDDDFDDDLDDLDDYLDDYLALSAKRLE
jgi:hypothetical protein